MSVWSITLLGGFELAGPQGHPCRLAARKPIALLAYLALTPGHRQTREKLAALLWGECAEAQARSSLRQALATLRRTLGERADGLLCIDGETVALHRDAIRTDVAEFEALVAEGTPQARDRAIALYSGDLLDGIAVQAGAFEDWLTVERQRLHELACGALSGRLDQAVATGEVEAGIRTAMRLLALDPLREPAHRALMQLYARQGRHALALKQYQTCRSLLEAEIGVLPEPQTERLFRDIRERRRSRPDRHAPVAPAGSATGDEAPPVEAAAPPEPELRHAALLCMTATRREPGEDMDDPEEAHARATALFERIGAIVAGHGGEVLRQAGDSALAAFGIRRSFGDEPRRAVRAALDCRTALAPLATLRTGIAAGMVVVGPERAGMITGPAVQEAPRLAAGAAADEILLCGRVRAALGDHAAMLPASVPDAAAVWRFIGWQHSRHPLVGRRSELRQFEAALDDCRRGVGSVIQLRGDPGIGKSRLIEAFTALAAGCGLACAAGAVMDDGVGRGQDALLAVVRSLAGSPDEVERLLSGELLSATTRLHLHPLLDRPHPPELRRVYETLDHPERDRGRRQAMAELVRYRSATAPLLLVVEDVHWADPPTLSYLAMLARVVAGCAAVLVLSTRVQGDPLGPAWRAEAGCPVLTLDLAPLRPQEARDLAAHYADRDDPRTERCVERAGGNPLFLEQLLRSRDAVGTVPGTIHGIVLARTGLLPAGDRRALQAAAVLGPRFPAEALDRLLGDPGYDPAPLVEQALIRRDGGDLLFSHALVQEAVYGSLLRSARRDLHRRAAGWYADCDPVRWAEHLDRAEDPAAVGAYLEAAEACAGDLRLERAIRLAERGLHLAVQPSDRFLLTCLRAELLDAVGEIPLAAEVFALARLLADSDAGRSRACLGLAAAKRVIEDLDGAMEALDEAETAAERVGLAADRARIHHMRGNLCFPRGDLDGCLREHQAALHWARQAGSADLETAALGGLGDGHYVNCRMATAHEHFVRCVTLARERGLARVVASNLYMAAITRLYIGDLRGAAEDIREGVRTAQAIGHRRAEMLSHICASEILFEFGSVEEARRHLEPARALVRALEARRFEAEVLLLEAKMDRLADRPADACARLTEALEICRETGMGYAGPTVLAALALNGGDPVARRAALAEGEALLARGSVGHNHLQFHRDAIEAALDLRDWDLVERHAAALDRLAAAEPLAWCRLFAARGRALADWERGRRDVDTRQALRAVAGELDRSGFAHPQAAVAAALGEEEAT